MNIPREGLVEIDKELNIISCDDSYKEYVCEDGAKTILTNVHTDDHHLLREMTKTLNTNDRQSLCFRFRNKAGEYCWVSANCFLTDKDSVSIDFQDISHIQGSVRESEFDYLTGLYNKKSITDYAKDLIGHSKTAPVTLSIIDIDNFKQVNDTYGHAFGDKVLKEVSSIIMDVVGDMGRVGRIGGDEMMLILEGVGEKTELRTYFKSIRERVEATHKDAAGHPEVTVSMGVGMYPSFVDNYEDLFNLADKMLYRAKNRGRNRYVIYNPEIHGQIINGVLDSNAVVSNKHLAIDKTKLVIGTINGLFGDLNESIPTLLMKITATYELDMVYMYYKDLDTSFHGFKRITHKDENSDITTFKVVDDNVDMNYITEEGFYSRFDSNGVLVIDSPQIVLKDTVEPKKFFDEHEIKHAFIYKMQNVPFIGYIAMYNTRELSRKFSQSDVTDLTYLSKMIEVAIKTR